MIGQDMVINLTNAEMLLAAHIGAMRQLSAIRKGLKDKHGFKDPERGWHVHILGAMAEVAVARGVGRYWSASVDAFKAGGDIGDNLQVRFRTLDKYDLIVRDDDRDDDVFVLVTGLPPTMRVRGWLYGKEAKQKVYRASHGDRDEAYFVPARNLHGMSTLPKEEKE